MSTRTKYIIGGVAVGLVALFILPGWLKVLIILSVIALPVVGYLMLDPTQRRKVRGHARKRLGS